MSWQKSMDFHKSTINEQEIENFEQDAQEWWNENGPFKPLHQLNPCRLSFIRNHLINTFSLDQKSFTPLKGLKILDVGCGGGLLCEPLARLGATVTGIDASPKAINVATEHAKASNLSIEYQCCGIEELAQEKFDAVLALEIIEHVDNPALFIEKCSKHLKDSGLFFLSTLNRTWQSYLGGILTAEYLLRWVPKGTHDWNKFLEPAELANLLRPHKLDFIDLKGIQYHPLKREWFLGNSLTINYIGCSQFTSC